MKSFINKVSWLLLKSYLITTLYLPKPITKIISHIITFLFISFSKKNYYTARLNIILCFKKSISPKQQHSLIKHSVYFSLYATNVIFSYLIKKNTNFINNIKIINKEILDETIAKYKKTIFVSAHLGIFPLIPIYLSYNNYPINVIIKPPHNLGMRSFIFQHMKNNNIGIIPTTPEISCYKKIIESFKNNSSLMFMIDQTPIREQSKIIAKLFEWNTFVYPTIAKLATEHNMPITPIFTLSNNNLNQHNILIFNHIQPASPELMINSIHQILEELILKYPYQWWWFHKKWYNLVDYNNINFYKLAINEPDNFFSYVQNKNCEEL